MAVPDTYTVPATIESATPAERGEEKRWSLKIKVPWSQHPITTFIGRDEATLDDLVKGSTHMVTLGRGRKIKDDSDGEKPWQYHWDVTAWDTKAAPTASNGDGQGDYRRSKEEMRWIEAIQVAAGFCTQPPGKPYDGYLPGGELYWIAEHIFHRMGNPPVSPFDAPSSAEPPVAEPAEVPSDEAIAASLPPRCTKHRKHYDQVSANSKRRFHQEGSYPCVEGIGVVNPETGEPIKAAGKKPPAP